MPTIDEVIAQRYSEFKIDRLIYHVVNPAALSHVEPLQFEGPEFRGKLAEGDLVLVPKIDFGLSEERAMARADEFLRAWEIAAGVELDREPVEFRFGRVEATGTDVATGAPVTHISAVVPEFIEVEIDATPPIMAYPGPPQVTHPDLRAEALWYRYRRVVEGKAELLPTAYVCLTILGAGSLGTKRAAAAKRLKIEVAVFDRVGELSSVRGDEKDARKVTPRNKPLAADEKAWLRNALKAIIMHLLVPQPGRVLKLDEIKPPLP